MAKRKSLKQQKFSAGQMLLTAIVFGMVGGVIGWAAFAAPHHGGTGTIALSLPPVKDNNGDGLPNYGDQVTFDITATISQPYVNVLCYQNNVLVMNSWAGFFDQALNPSRNFGLYSPSWQSGAADCTANLDQYTGKGKNPWTVLASTSFHVNQ